MPTPAELKTDLARTLDHIRDIFNKLVPITGPATALRPPDLHKLAEGLMLSAWSHWEEFGRDLMIEDLATKTDGVLVHDVKKFRTKKAPQRLAERIVNHPDHPNRFIEWHNYDTVRERAGALLGDGHRFVALGNPVAPNLKIILKIRNAIAHKSDKAHDDFVRLARDAPFSLPPASMKGLTPGRFLSSHDWAGVRVLLHGVETIRSAMNLLVP